MYYKAILYSLYQGTTVFITTLTSHLLSEPEQLGYKRKKNRDERSGLLHKTMTRPDQYICFKGEMIADGEVSSRQHIKPDG